MLSNPIVEKQQQEEAERRAREAFRYPFHIVCVYEDKENSDFPIISDVREFCSKNHLNFVNRQYDIDRYEEDMMVHRLPAFHIKYKRYVQETHYYDTDPVHKIQVVVWAYQDEQIAKERACMRRQAQWESFKESVSTVFSLERFKKKPALDPEASLSHSRDSNDPRVEEV